MNIEKMLEKWQHNIDSLLKDHQLRMLFELSEMAQSLLLESTLTYGEVSIYNDYSLFFQGKRYKWELRVEPEGKIIITRRSRRLFEWSRSTFEQFVNTNQKFTPSDLKFLKELINPLVEQIKQAAKDIDASVTQDNINQLEETYLNATIVGTGKDSWGRAQFVLSNGETIPAFEQLNEINKELRDKRIDGDKEHT